MAKFKVLVVRGKEETLSLLSLSPSPAFILFRRGKMGEREIVF
jgi:hypothetical protein